MKVKISVVVPVYNVEDYLEECVHSVLAQTYKNVEIVLADDGSTDSSPELCDRLSREYPGIIKSVHKKNGGLSSARNFGIRHACGDYVMFLDSDDFWDDKNALSELVGRIELGADVVCYGYREYSADVGYNGIGIDFSAYKGTAGIEKNEVLRSMLSCGIYVSSACCKAVKLSIIRENELYFKEGITSEDIDWSARLLKAVKTMAVYPVSFYAYRQRSDSIVHNIYYENIKMLSENVIRCVRYGEDIEDGEFKPLYFNYVSYQYITFIKVTLLCRDDPRTKELLKEMKQYSWLLDYHLNRKVKIMYTVKKFLGFDMMYRFMRIYFRGYK